MVRTVQYDQDELLQGISLLYLGGKTFSIDPCFCKGGFYKKLQRPQFIGDKVPRFKWCPQMDVTDLSWEFWNLESAVFDPPFLIGSGPMARLYGSFDTVEQMFSFFDKAIDNFHRVLRSGGILVVKIQDTSLGGQNFFSHLHISLYCQNNGFDLIDVLILVNHNRMRDKKRSFRMAVKDHCYFLVFRKNERRIRKQKF